MPFSFNGGQQSSNNWLLDGGRNQDTYNGNNLTMVNLDAIAEVRIERNAYSAEYGRNSGAQVNVITRSGTNSFHGSAFEFFRNDQLDARNFFAKAKPKNRYNNFGWTLGGPVKKDKVFFFLSNEYRRIWQSTGTRTAIVPTPAPDRRRLHRRARHQGSGHATALCGQHYSRRAPGPERAYAAEELLRPAHTGVPARRTELHVFGAGRHELPLDARPARLQRAAQPDLVRTLQHRQHQVE